MSENFVIPLGSGGMGLGISRFCRTLPNRPELFGVIGAENEKTAGIGSFSRDMQWTGNFEEPSPFILQARNEGEFLDDHLITVQRSELPGVLRAISDAGMADDVGMSGALAIAASLLVADARAEAGQPVEATGTIAADVSDFYKAEIAKLLKVPAA